MLHIPEDELHAYLDQALSRSQCVEIESHLASCPTCQAQRDRIAALRDRTTAMLAVLAPPVSLPPSIETIRVRAGVLQTRRHRLVRLGSWAASVIAALGLGWTAHVWTGRERAAEPRNPEAAIAVQETAAAQSFSIPDSSARSSTPSPRPTDIARVSTARHPVTSPAPVSDSAVPIDTIRPPTQLVLPTLRNFTADAGNGAEDSTRFSQSNSTLLASEHEIPELATESMWRIVSVAAAEEESGAPLPSVPGLRVVQVKVQGLQPNEKIVAVDQQLATGEVIRTMEGPAAQMTDLLARDGQRDRATAASRAFDALMTLRFGDRIVAIRGPADSLRALMNRLAMPIIKP